MALEDAFTLRVFMGRLMRILRPQRGQQQAESMQVYDSFVRCLEAPPERSDWEDEEWYWAEHRPRPNCLDKQAVFDYATTCAKEVEAKYGGRWCGVVKARTEPDENAITGRAAAEVCDAHILKGPDCSARRWVEWYRLQTAGQMIATVAKTFKKADVDEKASHVRSEGQTPAGVVRVHPDPTLERQEAPGAILGTTGVPAESDLIKRLKEPLSKGRGRPDEIDWASPDLDPPAPREPGQEG
jgi:hypothetical protein